MNDLTELDAARRRADAEGVIRRVHDYCEGRCSNREHCPGDACKLYREEMAAKDTLIRLDTEARQAVVAAIPVDAFGRPIIR